MSSLLSIHSFQAPAAFYFQTQHIFNGVYTPLVPPPFPIYVIYPTPKPTHSSTVYFDAGARKYFIAYMDGLLR